MYPQVKIVFNRKHQAAKNKPGVVEIYIYHEGKTQWLSTGVKVLQSQWKDRVGVVNCLDQDSLNERISVLLNYHKRQ